IPNIIRWRLVARGKTPPLERGGSPTGRAAASGFDDAQLVADAQHSAGNDVGAQAATMQERESRSAPADQALEVVAGLAQPDPVELDRPDTKAPPDQMVERDPARHEVAANVAGGERERVVA